MFGTNIDDTRRRIPVAKQSRHDFLLQEDSLESKVPQEDVDRRLDLVSVEQVWNNQNRGVLRELLPNQPEAVDDRVLYNPLQ